MLGGEAVASGAGAIERGSNGAHYFEYETFQLTDGKCLRWASFLEWGKESQRILHAKAGTGAHLSRPQKTWTIPRVAEVTGSEKSSITVRIRKALEDF